MKETNHVKKCVASRGNSNCQDPAVGIILACSRHSKKVTVAGAEYMRGKGVKVSSDK